MSEEKTEKENVNLLLEDLRKSLPEVKDDYCPCCRRGRRSCPVCGREVRPLQSPYWIEFWG